MKTGIRTLFLDIGGVLLTNGWDRHARRRAAQRFDLEYEDMDERHHLTFNTYEEGKLSLDEYLQRVVFHKVRSFSQSEFRTFMFQQSDPYQENIDYFKQLKERHGLKVAAVSNEGLELTRHRIDSFHLGDLIDFFISSSFVHMRKPDEDIYHLALQTAHTQPRESAYVDDRKLFVEVASRLGLNGVWHENLAATREKMGKLGLDLKENTV